jgi:hypothetical protein
VAQTAPRLLDHGGLRRDIAQRGQVTGQVVAIQSGADVGWGQISRVGRLRLTIADAKRTGVCVHHFVRPYFSSLDLLNSYVR